ncbi:thermonuclease family protein [Thermoleptolyngbya sp.]
MKFLIPVALSALIGGCSGVITGDRATVISITDGDSFSVEMSREKQRVRLCGIEAPELGHGGEEAKAELMQWIQPGTRVALDIIETDRYGRIVAEAWIPMEPPEIFLQEEMLKSGAAWIHPQYVDDCPNSSAMKQAEAIARENRRGIWENPSQIRPWEWRKLKMD